MKQMRRKIKLESKLQFLLKRGVQMRVTNGSYRSVCDCNIYNSSDDELIPALLVPQEVSSGDNLWVGQTAISINSLVI
jgi:hypothetical protein